MKTTGLMKAFRLSLAYKKMSSNKRKALQEERFRELVNYARKYSPYYKALYSDIGECFKLTDLPITNKVEMMAHFDEWLTDREVRLDDIVKFMENKDNIGRPFMSKYQVYTTSGSTGNPAVLLYNASTLNVTNAISISRGIARKEDFWGFIKRGGKSAAVYADGGFFMGNSTVRSRQLQNPRKKNQVRLISILQPIPAIVDELNSFQPAMLGGYPTALSLLAEEQKQGRLRISPVFIMGGGEYMSDDVRKSLEDAFGCYVQNSYACTEGSMVACECEFRHYHLNDDWIIMEPVDEYNYHVQSGKQADHWLLTNLSNFVQPLIRYVVTDRIKLHEEDCSCGNSSPWVEVEGRTDDILQFHGTDGCVRIVPLTLYALLKQIHEVQRFQLILHEENRIELRIVAENRQTAFENAKRVLDEYLVKSGITAKIELSAQFPQHDSKSGKFKHIYQQQS